VLSDALCRASQSGVRICVCIDNSETVIRNGYGEEKGITDLLSEGIVLKECKGNRISFLLADDESFVFFPESLNLIKDAEGLNAIRIDQVYACKLIQYFFPPNELSEKEAFQKKIENVVHEHFDSADKTLREIFENNGSPISQDFNKDIFIAIKESLQINPVERPDLTRLIKTYSAKIQFVELESEGLYIQNSTTRFPEDALPINDPALKRLLQTRLKAFQDFNIENDLPKINEIKKKLEEIRHKYLISLTCRKRKSVIKVDEKQTFDKEINDLMDELKNVRMMFMKYCMKK
jgi:hypothetical protein